MSDIMIAIDGPSASGKSTVARRVAASLDAVYVDSGAFYRTVTWKALQLGVDTHDAEALIAMLDACAVEFAVEDGAVCMRVDGVVPGQALRTEDVNANVSFIAVVPEIRRRVVDWLRGTGRFGSLVMEGRDIGTVVFPDTPHKFYLDADPTERARRRHAEMPAGEGSGSVEAVGDSLTRRDRIDSTRKTDPLTVASGAAVIDSTRMDIGEVVQFILDRVDCGN